MYFKLSEVGCRLVVFYNEYIFCSIFYYTKINAKTMMHYYCITLDYLYLILQYFGGFWSEIASVFYLHI